MRRNPLYIFKNSGSQGIYDVPLKSTVHIIDFDGKGTPKFIELIAKVGLDPNSTIGELLAIPEDYIDLFTVGEVYSELELIAEGGHTGWRILNRDPEYYGDIGEGAIDFSFNDVNSIQMGALGTYSMATGVSTSAWGPNSTSVGLGTIAGFENQFILGQYNKNNAINIFEIGIGNGVVGNPNERRNAFEITRDGIIAAPAMEVSDITNNKSLITKEYLSNFMGNNGGQLLKITENGRTGYRIANRDIEKYTDIGEGAVDLSTSTMVGDFNGSSGSNSFTVGYNVIMRNSSGTAIGQYNAPNDETVFEIGNGAGTVANERSNAIEVYLDGRVHAPSLSTDLIVEERSLVTKEYLSTKSIVKNNITDTIIDVNNIAISTYGITISDPYDINSIEVFSNGILLMPSRDYDVITFSTGINIDFTDLYTRHIGDWIRIKIPIVDYLGV